ncbi:MAG: AMP-binding protein [Chloroflexota bacterium]
MNEQINNLYELFTHRAAEMGDQPAFFSPEGEFSYAQFLGKVDAVAAGLAANGVVKGDRVATVALNSVIHFAALVACAKVGAVAFPANWRLSANELKESFGLIEPAVLIVEHQFIPLLADTDLSSIRVKAVWGEDAPEGFILFADLLTGSYQKPESVSEDDPAVIIATAAVAGTPRGAVLSHHNLLSSGRMFGEVFQLSEADRFLAVLPFFHIAGYQLLIVMAIAKGGSVILPGFDPDAGVKLIDQHQVSLIATFPPMLEMLIAAREKNNSNWDGLKVCFGILNPPEIIQQFLALGKGDYWTGYGQAETTGIATLINVLEKPGSAGKVVTGLEMRIVDDLDEDTQIGQPGEISVRGNLIFSGYWRDEEATSYASRNGWHHTGDLGKIDEQGYLYYVGRKPEKELIKSGGENIYPAEVELAIKKLPEVAEVCVIGVPDAQWGETVKAVVELLPGKNLETEALLKGITKYLATFKKPRLIEFVEKLPILESGKLNREEIKEIYG